MLYLVHLIRKIRNNLRNKKRLIFPAFNFDKFDDEINVNAGEIRWKNLLDIVGHENTIPSIKNENHLCSLVEIS